MTMQMNEALVNDMAEVDLSDLSFYGVIRAPRTEGLSPAWPYTPDAYIRLHQPRTSEGLNTACRRGYRSKFRLTRQGRLRLEGYEYPGEKQLEPHEVDEVFTGDFWAWFSPSFTYEVVLVPFRSGRIVLDEREWLYSGGRMDRGRVSHAPERTRVDFRCGECGDPAGGTAWFPGEPVAELAALQSAHPAAVLHALVPQRVPTFCPECSDTYCTAHWSPRAGGEACPRGHLVPPPPPRRPPPPSWSLRCAVCEDLVEQVTLEASGARLRLTDGAGALIAVVDLEPGSLLLLGLGRAPAAVLHAMSPDWVPAFCPPCDAVYCWRHRRPNGRCPEEHPMPGTTDPPGDEKPPSLPLGAQPARCWVWSPERPGFCHSLSEGVHLIGRARECQIPMGDFEVGHLSRVHAALHVEPWQVRLVDSSKHGTLVNDRPVKETRLQDGDRIEMGGVKLVFRDAHVLHGVIEPWDLAKYVEFYNTQAWSRGQPEIQAADVRPEERTEYERSPGGTSLADFAVRRYLEDQSPTKRGDG
jgi:hypothetical protein